MRARTKLTVRLRVKTRCLLVLVWIRVLKRVLTVLFSGAYKTRYNKVKSPNTYTLQIHTHLNAAACKSLRQFVNIFFYYLNSVFKCNIQKYSKHFVSKQTKNPTIKVIIELILGLRLRTIQ